MRAVCRLGGLGYNSSSGRRRGRRQHGRLVGEWNIRRSSTGSRNSSPRLIQLWDEEWVGFTWRNYTFEHVQRVRALSDLLAGREGADPLVLAYATTLHDITKGYDGEIIMKDGQRHLDDGGRWRNQFVAPARRNKVTDLYDRLDLAGLLHSESGAVVADALLAEYDMPGALRAQVGEVIRAHLRPCL